VGAILQHAWSGDERGYAPADSSFCTACSVWSLSLLCGFFINEARLNVCRALLTSSSLASLPEDNLKLLSRSAACGSECSERAASAAATATVTATTATAVTATTTLPVTASVQQPTPPRIASRGPVEARARSRRRDQRKRQSSVPLDLKRRLFARAKLVVFGFGVALCGLLLGFVIAQVYLLPQLAVSRQPRLSSLENISEHDAKSKTISSRTITKIHVEQDHNQQEHRQMLPGRNDVRHMMTTAWCDIATQPSRWSTHGPCLHYAVNLKAARMNERHRDGRDDARDDARDQAETAELEQEQLRILERKQQFAEMHEWWCTQPAALGAKKGSPRHLFCAGWAASPLLRRQKAEL